MMNGSPAILIEVDDHPHTTLTFEVQDFKITRVWALVNPDKLHHLSGKVE
jgi:hypothetical protein